MMDPNLPVVDAMTQCVTPLTSGVATGRSAFAVGLAVTTILGLGGRTGQAQAAIAVGTTLPIVFTASVDADHATPGDLVKAATMEQVSLADGESIPKGSKVFGHVVGARKFVLNETPYAVQNASWLAIHMDSVRVRDRDVPLRLQVRAMASVFTSEEAMTPRSSDEDMAQTRTLVGGDYITIGDDELHSPDADVVGYNKRQGMVAHLLQATASNAAAPDHCDGDSTEQAVAIFSASACGLYGFFKLAMPDNGATSGTFRLESRQYKLTLYHNTTALMQQIAIP